MLAKNTVIMAKLRWVRLVHKCRVWFRRGECPNSNLIELSGSVLAKAKRLDISYELGHFPDGTKRGQISPILGRLVV